MCPCLFSSEQVHMNMLVLFFNSVYGPVPYYVITNSFDLYKSMTVEYMLYAYMDLNRGFFKRNRSAP
jgi:hypothetical protein